MNVAIDLTAMMRFRSGVDRYMLSLVSALGRVDRENRYTVFVNREDRTLVAGLPANFTVLGTSLRARSARLAFQQIVFPTLAFVRRVDVMHSPSFIMPLLRGRPRHLLTVHDLTSFTRPECHTVLRRSSPYRAAVGVSIRRADLVHVPSDFVRGEVRRLFGDAAANRTVVIPHGISRRFQPAARAGVESVRSRLRLPDRYLLYVGTLEPRKNITLLLEAYTRLRRESGLREELVLAGQLGWGQTELIRALDNDELRGAVHMVGWVPEDELPALYAGATAFVYPSIEEGFGFPPLEAMASGVPTISTDVPSLRQNLGGAAELVQSDDVSALAGAIRRVLTDETYRRELRDAGLERARAFRWEDCARATIRSYEELARGKQAPASEAVGTTGG